MTIVHLIMTLTIPSKRWLLLGLSIYTFLQCTFFIGKAAHLLFYLSAPSVNGYPLLFSPYDMAYYFNVVFYTGLLISGLLFIAFTEPSIRRLVKSNRFISIPLSIIVTPLYFVLLFCCASGISAFKR
jgi:hypothetical protein